MTESRELVAREHPQRMALLFPAASPHEVVQQATEAANALKDVLVNQKLIQKISGRDHVRVEGWTLLGSMVGVFAVPVWTRRLTYEQDGVDGWEARVEARTMRHDLVGAADAQCDRSETLWADRDEYALRSMAQTRATSKALRLPLGFIVQIAGYDPTPAEEMVFDAQAEPVQERPADPPPQRQPVARQQRPPARRPARPDPARDPDVDVPLPPDASCPQHGTAGLRVGRRGQYYCARPVGKDDAGEAIWCDYKWYPPREEGDA